MESPAASGRLIGDIFVEQGIVTPEQLAEALRIQRETGERLGEVLVRHFGVSRLDLASVLAERWADYDRSGRATRRREEPVVAGDSRPAADSARPIGAIFLEQGAITQEQLDAALEEQQRTGERIGEILVAQGSLSRMELASALAEQWSGLQKQKAAPRVAAVPDEQQDGGGSVVPLRTDLADSLVSRLQDVAGRVDLLEEGTASLDSLDERIAAVVRAASGALRLRLDELARTVEELAAAPATVRVEGGEAASATLAAAVERLDARVDGIAEALRVGLEETVGALARRVDEAQQRPDTAFEERLAALVTEATRELHDRIDHLAAGSNDPAAVADVAGLRDELAELGARLEALASAPAVGPERVDALDRALSDVRASLAEVSGRPVPADAVEGLRREIESLAGRVDVLVDVSSAAPSAEHLEAFARRLDELEQRAGAVDHSREELDALHGRLAAAEDVLSGVHELRGRVDELAAAPVAAEELAAKLTELSDTVEAVRSALPGRDLDDVRARLDAVEPLAGELLALAGLVEELSASRAAADDAAGLAARVDAVADLASRLTAVEHRTEDVESLRSGPPELQARLAVLESSLAGLAEAAAQTEQVTALRDEIESLSGSLEGVRAALPNGELADLRTRTAALEPLAVEIPALRAVLDELTRTTASAEVVTALAHRVEEVAGAVEAVRSEIPVADVERLRDAVAAVEQTGSQSRLDLEALRVRADGIARSVGALESGLGEVAELRHLLGALRDETASADDLSGLAGRVDELAGLIAALRADVPFARVEELQQAVSGLEVRAHDARLGIEALRARLEEVDGRTADLDDLRSGLRDLAQAAATVEQVAELGHRIGELHRLLDEVRESVPTAAVEELAGTLSGLADRLANAQRGLRTETERIAAAAAGTAESLSLRIEEVRESIPHAAIEDLFGRVDALERRLAENDEADERMRQALEQLVHESTDAVRVDARDTRARLDEAVRRLEAVEGTAARLDMFESRLDEERVAATGALDVAAADLRSRIADAVAHADERTSRMAAETAALRAALDGVRDSVHEHARLLEDERMAGLPALADDLRARMAAVEEHVSAEAERAAAATRDALGSFALELGALRSGARELEDALRGEVAAHGSSIDTLGAELGALRGGLEAHEDWLRRVEESLDTGARELHARADAETAARHELAAQVDDVAGGLSQALARIERGEGQAHAVREELGGRVGDVSARLDDVSERLELGEADARRVLDRLDGRIEEVGAAASEGHEELRRTVERLEQRLVDADLGSIREAVDEFHVRLDAGAALAEQQSRLVEEALREGLTALDRGLRSVEDVYRQVGETMRSSLDRLTTTGFEAPADAEPAATVPDEDWQPEASQPEEQVHQEQVRQEQPAVDELPGWVAFLQTLDGYRILVGDGNPPDLGDEIGVDGQEGTYVVCRLGRSPLPRDERTCVYLEPVPAAGS